MDSYEDERPRYLVKLELNGTNYGAWALGVRVHLRALGLWGHITGESACPPAPVPPPTQPPAAAKVVADAASKASKDYQRALDAYKEWETHDARAMLVLLDTVQESMILSLPTESAQKAWTYLQKRYKPIVEAVHYTSLQQFQALRQYNDESIDAFFDRFMDLWCKLESLVPLTDVCEGCACCKRHQEQNDKRCLYEFLIRLCPKFALSKNQLLFRDPPPTVYAALNDLRVAEIRLQSMSNELSTVLAGTVISPKTDIQCNHCGNFGHTYQKCNMRKNRRNGHSRKGSSKPFGGSSSSQS